LHPNSAAVGLDNAFDDGKSESQAVVPRFRSLPEAVEHTGQVIAFDSASRIRHGEKNFARTRPRAYYDPTRRLGKLGRIAHKVFKYLKEPVAVHPNIGKPWHRVETKLKRCRGYQRGLRIEHLRKDIMGGNTFPIDRQSASLQLSRVNNVPDEAVHSSGGLLNLFAYLLFSARFLKNSSERCNGR